MLHPYFFIYRNEFYRKGNNIIEYILGVKL